MKSEKINKVEAFLGEEREKKKKKRNSRKDRFDKNYNSL